jgi:hypothetical protein
MRLENIPPSSNELGPLPFPWTGDQSVARPLPTHDNINREKAYIHDFSGT